MSAQLALDLKAPAGRFYVTTRLTPEEAKTAVARAESQTHAVLALFRAHLELTPSQAHGMLAKAGLTVLLTSVRRSISDLTRDRILRKTTEQRPGPWGMPETVWALAA